MSDQVYPSLFSLTELTGKRSKDERTMVIQGVEMPRRYGIIAFVAFLPSMFAGISVFPFFGGVGAVIVFGIAMLLAFLIIEARSRKGLKLRMYQTVFDKGQNYLRKLNGNVIRCGRIIDPLDSSPGFIRLSSQDNRTITGPTAEQKRTAAAEESIFNDEVFETIEDVAARHRATEADTRVSSNRDEDYMLSGTLTYDD